MFYRTLIKIFPTPILKKFLCAITTCALASSFFLVPASVQERSAGLRPELPATGNLRAKICAE